MEQYSLTVEHVYKHYTQRVKSKGGGLFAQKKTVKAVDGVSIGVASGEIVGIIGESGCGKSTLGKLIIKLEDMSSGKICLEGRDINDLYRSNRLGYRRMVQMVFQNPFDTFDPRHTIEKVLMEALSIHGIGADADEKRSLIMDGIEHIGLKPAGDYLGRFPHELSGGQLQRISILRSMLLGPRILIADEPVSMLDVSVRADVIEMLKSLTREKGTAMLFISHDINTVRYISDRVAVMYLGRIVEEGITDEVLHKPVHPYTQALISNRSSIDVNKKRNIIRISGEPPTPIDNGPGCYFAPRCGHAVDKCRSVYPDKKEISSTHSASCHLIK